MKLVTCPSDRSPFSHSAWLLASAALAVSMLCGDPASSLAGRRAHKPARVSAASAAPRSDSMASQRPKKLGEYNPADETVELFDALEAGRIAVKMIPKDVTEGRVFIRNKSGKPLNVKLPEAFAATPVLAQMMGGGGGGGQGGGGGGMGMMNVPADKELNVRLPFVCLEHGKPDPRPKMTYELKRVKSFTEKPGISELLAQLARGDIDQRAAQAAAWHMNNDMSWEELAAKRIEYGDGTSAPYFNLPELQQGMAAAQRALADAEKPSDRGKPSPGETALRGE